MNNYCIDLNIPVTVFNSPVNLEALGSRSFHTKATDLHNDFYALFDKLNLEINLAEIFYIPKFGSIRIHEDGGEKPDVLKLNWVFGGNGSLMHWYKPIAEPIWDETILGVKFRHYTKDKVELIHSQHVGCPSLLQVGIPHNVETTTQNRLCLSVVPAYKDSGKLLTFNEGIEIFKEYIGGA